MNWFSKFITSSIGQKIVMSLTGLFLITFLIAHLVGNLQLLKPDGGLAFNEYAYFMTTNPLVKTVSYGLYFFILLHAIQGLMLWAKNRKARGNAKYAVSKAKTASTHAPSFAGNNMALLGTIILIFLGIHMGDFWFAMKFGHVDYMPGTEIKDLYSKVVVSFKQWWIVAIYVVSMIALVFHLMHGFWSAFQTLGLTHKKYAGLIKTIGLIISILIPLGFAILPIWMFLTNS